MICHMLLKITWHVLEQCKLKNKNSFISLFFFSSDFFSIKGQTKTNESQRESDLVQPIPRQSVGARAATTGVDMARKGEISADLADLFSPCQISLVTTILAFVNPWRKEIRKKRRKRKSNKGKNT